MSRASEHGSPRPGLLGKLDPEGRMNLASCLQCGRCSSGCTMRLETDILPHQINRMIVFGLEDELLRSRAIWTCASCHTCVSRCPMRVDTPAAIDHLRMLAKSPPADVKRVRIFNDVFLGWVRRFGRTYEMGLMAEYKLRARDFFSDIAKLPMMLRKGKMSLTPPPTGGRREVARIFARSRRIRRAER